MIFHYRTRATSHYVNCSIDSFRMAGPAPFNFYLVPPLCFSISPSLALPLPLSLCGFHFARNQELVSLKRGAHETNQQGPVCAEWASFAGAGLVWFARPKKQFASLTAEQPHARPKSPARPKISGNNRTLFEIYNSNRKMPPRAATG